MPEAEVVPQRIHAAARATVVRGLSDYADRELADLTDPNPLGSCEITKYGYLELNSKAPKAGPGEDQEWRDRMHAAYRTRLSDFFDRVRERIDYEIGDGEARN